MPDLASHVVHRWWPEAADTSNASWEASAAFISGNASAPRAAQVHALDNIMVERLWRSVKYEEVYLKEYESVVELA